MFAQACTRAVVVQTSPTVNSVYMSNVFESLTVHGPCSECPAPIFASQRPEAHLTTASARLLVACITMLKLQHNPIVCNVAQHVSPSAPSHRVPTAHLVECTRLQHIVRAAIKLLHRFIRAWTAVIVDFDGSEGLPQCFIIITQRHCDLS